MGFDCAEWTLREAVNAISRGEISAVEYAKQLLLRAEDHAHLNTFISLQHSLLVEAAEKADVSRRSGVEAGPLHGIPLAVKDNIDTSSLPTTGGTPALRGHRPRRDAWVVDRLRQAGALVLGKTNMDELAYGVTSDNQAFGSVRNPYRHTHIAGGSSGGTAAAIAARLAPGGLGTDTGGSIRIPAALCGVAGLRPSMGRYGQQGLLAISPTRDTVGPMGRTVDDLALLDAALTGQSHSDVPDLSSIRIGVPRFPFYQNLDPATEQLVRHRLRQLQKAGMTLVEADMPPRAVELTALAGFPIVFYETPVSLKRYMHASGFPGSFEDLVNSVHSPDVKEILESLLGPAAVDTATYNAVLTIHRPQLQHLFREHLRQHNLAAILFPTTPVTACSLTETTAVNVNGTTMPAFQTYIRNTNPASVIGWAGLTLPAGLDAHGLPVGIELDGPQGSDTLLLAIGRHCERIWGPVPSPNTQGR
ncbi:indoleacetamide hydrolase [Streptomyces sp. NPDC053431]|uniref:indoleacetamide hydrolase n=1 Tax=Streptomyces sp. NPDC053431 TaxID=3365703 RepID=UPI0037D22055